MKAKFPVKIEVTTVFTNEKKIVEVKKDDCKGVKTIFQLIDLLNAVYQEPNFKWEFVK